MNESHTSPTSQLFQKLKRYLSLKLEYYRLNTLEKGSLFLGYMLMILTCLLFGCFALLCISFALAFLLGEWLGSFVWGFLLIAFVYILLIFLLIRFKEVLLIDPMIRILDRSLFKKRRSHEETEI